MGKLTGVGLLDAVSQWERLANRGLIVAVAYGPGTFGPGWYFEIQDPRARAAFERPLYGRDLAHCLEIAEREALARGWMKP